MDVVESEKLATLQGHATEAVDGALSACTQEAFVADFALPPEHQDLLERAHAHAHANLRNGVLVRARAAPCLHTHAAP